MKLIRHLLKRSGKRYMHKLVCTSHIGNVRKKNEDNFYFDGHYMDAIHQTLDEILISYKREDEHMYVALFDGMGGECAGEIASYVAAKTFADVAQAGILGTEEVVEVTRMMNQKVCDRCVEEKVSQMGTTMILADFHKEGWIANLGDSLAFLYRNNSMRHLTVAHTNEKILKELGIINRKPGLTQFLGIPSDEYEVEPHIEKIILNVGDICLMCSDGLTDMVSEERITEILGLTESLEDKVQRLLDEALRNGGRDNITIIACEVS